MLESIIVIVCMILTIYFGFVPYETQCSITKMILPNCYPRFIYIGGCIVFFVIGIFIYHNEYLLKLKIHE